MKRGNCGLRWAAACLLASFLLPLGASAQAGNAPKSSLPANLTVGPTGNWVELHHAQLPPPRELLPSAPALEFSDLMAFENRDENAILKLGLSNNMLEGSDRGALETRMLAGNGAGLVESFFYLFFPPPRNCLVRARAALEAAEREEAARVEREEAQAQGKDKQRPTPRRVSINRSCEFGPTLADFYASQVSSGVVMEEGRVRGVLRPFYAPPLEQVEIDGRTFFIFEAQGQRFLEFDDLQRFALPDNLHGARAFFFWAVGAESPFPFLRDPMRKSVQLTHVAYACLGANTTDARPRFRSLLERLRFD